MERVKLTIFNRAKMPSAANTTCQKLQSVFDGLLIQLAATNEVITVAKASKTT
ncbi:MAG TPA: hypothetical protein VKA49_08270 [Flavitalea sp.]|nr:hypothetical protein [Flavitalea sp.]